MSGKRKLEGRALGRDIGAIIGKRAALPPAPTKAETARVENVAPPRAGAVATVERGVSLPTEAAVHNSLGEAVGFPGGGGVSRTEAVVNPQTLFNNTRWYLISNFRHALSQAYVEIGLVQTIVDVPVDDALRGGIKIKSKILSEENIEELALALERDDDLTLLGQAAKWNRLFGGGAVLVLTEQDPETPLDLEALDEESLLEFRAVDLWELNYTKLQASEGGDGVRLDDEDDDEDDDDDCYNYYGHKIHKTRVLKLEGITPPSFVRPRMRGWGVSVVETLVRSINQYLKGTALGFEVLDEFKLDVFKIKGLTNSLLSPQGKEKIATRISIANWQKNFQSALVMDAEDDYDHKQLSFAGLAEAMSGIRLQVAADMRMPLTRLFGQSATGFNSGEDDIEVYNAMIEGQIRGKLRKPILRIMELKCQKLFGMVPDDLSFEFKPLRVLSAVDEENVKTQKFNRLLQAKERGEITVKEFRDACNKGGLFDIALDTDDAILGELEATAAAATPPPAPGAPPAAGAAKAPAAAAKPAATPLKAPPKAGVGGKAAPVLNAADALKIKFWERYPNVGAYHSSGDRETATKTARMLRKDGVEALIWHIDGPKTGLTSEYVVAVPERARNSDKFDEGKHPRADDGKFGKGSGGAGKKYPDGGGVPDVIGETSSGKKIHSYFEHPEHEDFTEKDHADAERAHEDVYQKLTEEWREQDSTNKRTAKAKRKDVAVDPQIRRDVFVAMQEISKKHGDVASAVSKKALVQELVRKAVDAVANKDAQMARLHVKALKELGVDQDEFDRLRADAGKKPEASETGAASGGSDKPAKASKPMASIDESGQIKLTKPKTVEQATELLDTVGNYLTAALDAVDKDPTPNNKMRAAHAHRQLQRAMALGKAVAASSKKENAPRVLSQTELAALLRLGGRKERAIAPYTALERAARVVRNSAEFDRASYAADGGDGWIDPRRKDFFTTRPAAVDAALWVKACEASQKSFGEFHWQFVAWYCRKFGGKSL